MQFCRPIQKEVSPCTSSYYFSTEVINFLTGNFSRKMRAADFFLEIYFLHFFSVPCCVPKIVTFGKNTYFHVPSRNTSLYDECKLISQKKIGVTNFLVNRLDNKHPLHPNQVTRWALNFLPGMILTIFYRGTIKNCNLVKFDNKRGSLLEKPGLSPLMKFFIRVEASQCAFDGKVT